MNPLIGVIVPVFNGERYLGATLESILAQSYRPLEIVVVDDGSTDGSMAVIGRFGRAVNYVRQPNQGTGAARNRGVLHSTADYLAFLDQDDLWSSDKLIRQMEALRAHESADMVFGQVQQFRSPDWQESTGSRIACPERPMPGYLPSALLVRRTSFLRVGPFDTRWRLGAWTDWYARARDAGLVAHMLSDVVAWRRIHGGNHGLVARASVREYARILKESLDRRRGWCRP
jgi:glycosyltransferase involved in cell wall biosynthesis